MAVVDFTGAEAATTAADFTVGAEASMAGVEVMVAGIVNLPASKRFAETS
jgi:hypothetical protein